MSTDAFEFEIQATHRGQRLDRTLAELVAHHSRTRIQRGIEAGAVTVDGELPARGAKTRLQPGQIVTYTPLPPETPDLRPEPIPLEVVYEDPDLIVVNKPANLVVHPAPGHPHGTLINAVLYHVRQLSPGSDATRPGVVHRLDRDTTGLIILAKRPVSHERLSAAFAERRVDKRYLAITRGVPKAAHGTIDTGYGRHPRDRKRFTSRIEGPRRAVTHFERREVFPGAARFEVRLETGRTHQIRVHFADMGHPLLGDPVYGSRRRQSPHLGLDFSRPALHAERLAFDHPRTGRRLELTAPVPPDLQALLTQLRARID